MTIRKSDSIFGDSRKAHDPPLAAKLRPQSLSDVVGHDQVIGENGFLKALMLQKGPVSIVLAGPPGTGKTTIARLVAKESARRFVPVLASALGVKEIKDITEAANQAFSVQDFETVVFVDEVHRLTRVQSDALLAPVEDGVFSLFGATTENPWMALSPALLSRVHVIELQSLSYVDIAGILERAMTETDSELQPGSAEDIFTRSGGDARAAVNIFEASYAVAAVRAGGDKVLIGRDDITRVGKRPSKGLSSADHYEYISALIKSMRASEGNAALYWLARLLVAGEDPRFIARRLVVFASEDVGLADPLALVLAEATMGATETIGMPEVRINLGHCVAYLSRAGKSRLAYGAINRAIDVANKTLHLGVPTQLRGSVTEVEAARGKSFIVPQEGSLFPVGLAPVNFLEMEGYEKQVRHQAEGKPGDA